MGYLCKRRVIAVYDYLIKKGVPDCELCCRFTTNSVPLEKSELDGLAPLNAEALEQLKRRVDFDVIHFN